MELINKNPKIFILSGKARSGKDEVADIIINYYKNKKIKKLSYAYYLKQYTKHITGWSGSEDDKPRDFLQTIGIDLIKNKIDNKLLINRVCEDILVYSYFYDIIIVTDARLISEIEIPKKHFSNITIIRINRNIDNGLTFKQKEHITETNLDNYQGFDYIIENNDNYDLLVNEVNCVLKGVNL